VCKHLFNSSIPGSDMSIVSAIVIIGVEHVGNVLKNVGKFVYVTGMRTRCMTKSRRGSILNGI
jgi:hypothetical protein